MTLRQPSAKPGEDPQAPSSVHTTHSDDDERAPREGLHTALTAFALGAGSGLRGHLHLRSRIPRDIC